MSGATASLPDLRPALDAASNARSGLAGFLQVAGSLAGGGAGSPLGTVTVTLNGLHDTLRIDMKGLSERLPQVLTTIENALPADALRFVEELNQSYQALADFLAHSELVRQIRSGASLEQTALALVDDVLGQFTVRLASLGGSLIDADTLARVTEALATLERMAAGHPPAAGDLPAFLAQQLVGVEHDLLAAARGGLGSALALLDPLSPAALEARIGALRDAAAAAFRALALAVRDFDAADAAAYPALEALLTAWADALEAAFAAVEAACAALAVVIDEPAWDGLFAAHAAALAAVPLDQVPTVDDAVEAMAGLLESLLARLRMSLSPQDLAAQVARVSASVHDLFAQSALAQVRQILLDFIGRIHGAVDAIPLQAAQQAVTGMLRRVHEELDRLGIDQVRGGIAAGFQAAHDFIDQRIGDDLLGGVADALDGALRQFDSIPIAELGQALAGVVGQAGELIGQLEGRLSSALDELKALLARLDDVDFRPLADEVVDEIDALKTRLAAIRPESLSTAEKVALQAGLAVLRSVNLESLIETELKTGFAAIDGELTRAVQAVLDAWLEFRRRIGGFDGAALVAPINGLLDQVDAAVKGVNGASVLAPLDALVDDLLSRAQALSPAVLLEPLKVPYQRMMRTIDRANPDVWVRPLRSLHAEIDRLVALVDITPLLDTLERKERELFAQARGSLAGALDGLHLPPPLDAFLDTMKALVLGLSDAVFADPDGSLRQFNLSLAGSVRPSTLFQPLDQAFDRLVAAIDALPPEQALAALEDLRTGIGTALPALNPAAVLRTMRNAQAGLAALSPTALAGVAALPALRVRLDARLDPVAGHEAAQAALRARFDLALAPLDPGDAAGRLRRLDAAHQALAAALRRRINGLDSGAAQAAYARLDAGLGRLLPGFLRQPQPLSMADVRAGLAALRPSTKARRIDLAVDRFLADLAPLQTALDGSVNGFFGEIRQAALALHPAGLKDAVAGVYASLRDKLHGLDPDRLAAELRTAVWEPLTDPLRAIDPAALQAQLDGLFRQLLDKLGSAVRGLLARLKLAIDAFLKTVRAALAQVLGALKAQIEHVLDSVTALLGQLDALVVDELFHRLLTLLANLQTSFDRQLDRVRNEFDAMLDAIPLGAPSSSIAVAA